MIKSKIQEKILLRISETQNLPIEVVEKFLKCKGVLIRKDNFRYNEKK